MYSISPITPRIIEPVHSLLDPTCCDTAEAALLDSQTTVGATLGVSREVCKWVFAIEDLCQYVSI